VKTYKSKEVQHMLNIRKSRLQYYVDSGVVNPEIDTTGRGVSRRYSQRNMVEVKLAMVLIRLGIGVETVARIIKSISRHEGMPSALYIKYSYNGTVTSFGGISEGGTIPLITSDNAVMLVNVDKAINGLDSAGGCD